MQNNLLDALAVSIENFYTIPDDDRFRFVTNFKKQIELVQVEQNKIKEVLEMTGKSIDMLTAHLNTLEYRAVSEIERKNLVKAMYSLRFAFINKYLTVLADHGYHVYDNTLMEEFFKKAFGDKLNEANVHFYLLKLKYILKAKEDTDTFMVESLKKLFRRYKPKTMNLFYDYIQFLLFTANANRNLYIPKFLRSRIVKFCRVVYEQLAKNKSIEVVKDKMLIKLENNKSIFIYTIKVKPATTNKKRSPTFKNTLKHKPTKRYQKEVGVFLRKREEIKTVEMPSKTINVRVKGRRKVGLGVKNHES